MGRWAVFGGAVVLSLSMSSCGPAERVLVNRQREAALKGFQPIAYTRTGEDIQERITIAADGSLIRVRSIGTSSGKLSEFQLMQLKRLFDDWDKLNSQYLAETESEPVAVTTIKYGQKEVTVSDGVKESPEVFVLIRRKIEECAHDVAKPVSSGGGAP